MLARGRLFQTGLRPPTPLPRCCSNAPLSSRRPSPNRVLVHVAVHDSASNISAPCGVFAAALLSAQVLLFTNGFIGVPAALATAQQTQPQEDVTMSDDGVAPAVPSQVRALMDLLESGRFDQDQLVAAREKAGFRRDADGRVSVRGKGGQWFLVKPDSQVAGYLLLRDEQGFCCYIPADQAGRVQQIDLSSDGVVAQLFGNAAWEDVMQPLLIEVPGQDATASQVLPLNVDSDSFRGVLSLLEGAVDAASADGSGENK